MDSHGQGRAKPRYRLIMLLTAKQLEVIQLSDHQAPCDLGCAKKSRCNRDLPTEAISEIAQFCSKTRPHMVEAEDMMREYMRMRKAMPTGVIF